MGLTAAWLTKRASFSQDVVVPLRRVCVVPDVRRPAHLLGRGRRARLGFVGRERLGRSAPGAVRPGGPLGHGDAPTVGCQAQCSARPGTTTDPAAASRDRYGLAGRGRPVGSRRRAGTRARHGRWRHKRVGRRVRGLLGPRVLWNPWFILGGIAFLLAARRERLARRARSSTFR